jgi:NADH-ubiquinone oxidoreductase chain 1
MCLILLIWVLVPLTTGFHNFLYSTIIVVMLMRFGVYPLLLAGWSSNRKYALIGGLRGVSQTISYEIRLALIIMVFLIFLNRYCLERMLLNSAYARIFAVIPLITLLWLVSCLAETNRTPFDFSEGESELVSGFNIEYGSGGFALIFIAEYARIYFLSALTSSLAFGWRITSPIRNLISVFIVFFWVWARATLPRFRYDLLINLAWKCILPSVLGALELSLLIVFI